ncbi:hypothetical protein BX600DRAFT_460308 [Xylariales sp. PMI_506]|nr:hypothetical protein BX600DRAFT_460308 [Xylariales sp. PMI_506]
MSWPSGNALRWGLGCAAYVVLLPQRSYNAQFFFLDIGFGQRSRAKESLNLRALNNDHIFHEYIQEPPLQMTTMSCTTATVLQPGPNARRHLQIGYATACMKDHEAGICQLEQQAKPPCFLKPSCLQTFKKKILIENIRAH